MRAKLGVCSWSLQPKTANELVARVSSCGLSAIQIALDPLRSGEQGWEEEASRAAFDAAGLQLLSGMMGTVGEDYTTLDTIKETGGVRIDAHWEANLTAAHENAALAERLGLSLVTLHAGFLPHDPDDPERGVLIERLRAIVDAFAEHEIRVGFETGQETAQTLLGVLEELDRPQSIGVNFDPANMILYGMGDPVEALSDLLPHVLQVHIKDATPTSVPGEWGAEVPAGEGTVDWAKFFAVLGGAKRDLDLVIEREAGEARVEDVRKAAGMVGQICG